jgi:hypothetical protein
MKTLLLVRSTAHEEERRGEEKTGIFSVNLCVSLLSLISGSLCQKKRLLLSLPLGLLGHPKSEENVTKC